MKNEIEKTKSLVSDKQKNVDAVDSNSNIPLQPLILRQVHKNIKGTKSLPYKFGEKTYEVYRNPKNPFMVGILAADTDSIKLDPIKTKNLFQQFEENSTYSIEYPLNISAHRKRKVFSPNKSSIEESKKDVLIRNEKVKSASLEYLPREKLMEDKRKLQTYIQSFCNHFLKRIKDNSDELNTIVNEMVPLFVKHRIKIRFYDAFRQIYTIDDLICTLEKICDDFELENFELFCSALFVFYSTQKIG